MANKKITTSFEEELSQYFHGPAPRKEFYKKLEQTLQARTSKTNRFSVHRLRPSRPVYVGFGIGLALLLVFFAVGPDNVLAGISQWLKFIPGFGFVNREVPIRTLAEPVSQTRTGVLINVKQAVLTEEKTGIVFTQKGLSPKAVVEYDGQNSEKICSQSVELILPDGTRILSEERGSLGYDEDQAAQYVYYFQPLPADQRDATLYISCISGAGIGLAPEDWEIPLQFVDAPQDYVLMPVVEITPSQTTVASQPISSNPLILERVIETDDGYIFVGQFKTPRTNITLMKSVEEIPYITDGNGKRLMYTVSGDLPQRANPNGNFLWAYEIHDKEIAWPVNIHFDSVRAVCQDTAFQIEVETGTNPEEGQIWNVDKVFDDNLCGFRVISLMRTSKGYSLSIGSTETRVKQVSPEIAGPSPVSDGVREYMDHIVESVDYKNKEEVPTGLLKISFPMVTIEIQGPWSVQWQP